MTPVQQISELQNPAYATMDSLTSHAEATHSTLLYATLPLFTDNPSSEASHAMSHLGVAHAMMTLLRALPFHASKGVLIIPPQITAKHGLRQEDVFRYGGDAKGIDDAVFEFATAANDNLITAREMFEKAPDRKVIWPIFMSEVSANQVK
jgi:NADH dehydrogenase [ubiquinone] 1 alpha subcomplex assembly factor 6